MAEDRAEGLFEGLRVYIREKMEETIMDQVAEAVLAVVGS